MGEPRHLELPYARVLPACLAFAPTPLRTLIIGLGGGSLPRFFHRHFPTMAIDVVELDHGVVEVAKEFCGFGEDGRMHVHVEDGRDFIEASGDGYDLVVLDCFDTDSIPPHLSTLEFLSAVRKTLSPSGIVVANVWGRASNPLYAHMLLTYRAAFEDVYVFDVPAPGTKIFVALQRKQSMSREDLVALAQEISQERGFTYGLHDAIAGFRNAQFESISGGHVLKD